MRKRLMKTRTKIFSSLIALIMILGAIWILFESIFPIFLIPIAVIGFGINCIFILLFGAVFIGNFVMLLISTIEYLSGITDRIEYLDTFKKN